MNTMLSRFLPLLVLILLPLGGAQAADDRGRDRDRDRHHHGGPPRIILYERANFQGASLEVEVDATVLDLSLLRFPNGARVDDRVSSLEVERGVQVKIFVDDGFRGEFLELTRSVENLADMARAGGQNWNDTLSSLRVYESRHGRPRGRDPSRTPRIIVFSRKDFHGEALEIFPGETMNNLNREHFESGTDLNKEISSVRVVGPVRLRLFTDKDGRGESVDLTADSADLNEIRRREPRKNWNDQATSLQVEWVGSPRKLEVEPEDGPEHQR